MAPRPVILNIADNRFPLNTLESITLFDKLIKGKVDINDVKRKAREQLQQHKALVEKEVQIREIEVQKYLTDLKVAFTIDKRLFDFLENEAKNAFLQKQKEIKSLLEDLARRRENADKNYQVQVEDYLLEKQKLIDSLYLQIASLDNFVLAQLNQCFAQIEHLDNKIKNIQAKQENIVRDLNVKLLSEFERPENKVDGKNILEAPPENQANFAKALLNKSKELKEWKAEDLQLEAHQEITAKELSKAKQQAAAFDYDVIRTKENINSSQENFDEDESWEYEAAQDVLESLDLKSEEEIEMLVRLHEEEEHKAHDDEDEPAEFENAEKINKKLDKMERKEEEMREKIKELIKLKNERLKSIAEKKQFIDDKKAAKGKKRTPMTLAVEKMKLKQKEDKLLILRRDLEAASKKYNGLLERKEALAEKVQSAIEAMAQENQMHNMFSVDKDGRKYVKKESVRNLLENALPLVEAAAANYNELAEQKAACAIQRDNVRAYAHQIYDEGMNRRAECQATLSALGHEVAPAAAAIDAIYAKTQAKAAEPVSYSNRERISSS